MKCNICGRFMRNTQYGPKCKVHPFGMATPTDDRARIEDPVKKPETGKECLTALECMYLIGKGKVIEVWIKFTSGMAKSEGKWMVSTNQDLVQFESSIAGGMKYRQRPEPKVEAPKETVVVELRVKKTLDEMDSGEIEQRMAEAAEVMTKFGSATKLPSGKTILIMEVD